MNSNTATNSRLKRPETLDQDNLDSECTPSTSEAGLKVNSAFEMDNFPKSQTLTFMLNPAKRKSTTTTIRLLKVFTLLVLNSLLNQSSYITNRAGHHHYHQQKQHHHHHHQHHCNDHFIETTNDQTSYESQSFLSSFLAKAKLPTIILAGAVECQSDGDCSRDKFCHESKCICTRDKPIELDQERCLPRTLIEESCVISDQCLGDSICIDGICSCGNNAISLFNPSAKIFYCHPKLGLNEQCNHDLQCPANSYCSTKKSGCLCQNGFAESTVNNDNKETKECLPKFCTSSETCESEYHECEDNKCKCLATHFDPTTAKCYKFGSIGGKTSDQEASNNGTADNNADVISKSNDTTSTIFTILKDLKDNGDKMWLVLLILILLSIIIFVLIFILVRKYYSGFCWTTHKKEYEPNNKSPPKNGYFNKNSINNKSFRQKNAEAEDETDEEAALDNKSNCKNGRTGNQIVEINMDQTNDDQHHYVGPLSSSTSTPV